MADSIRVPGSLVRRMMVVARWATPFLIAGAGTAVAFTWQWIRARVDHQHVAVMLVEPIQIAKAAQTASHHVYNRTLHDPAEIVLLWRQVVLLHAELLVHSRYGSKDPRTKGELILKAREFYGDGYDALRKSAPNDVPSETARLALKLSWRPDKP